MKKINFILIGLVIGCYLFNIFLIIENKELKKELNNLKEENDYLRTTLQEIPLIVESRKDEICKEMMK